MPKDPKPMGTPRKATYKCNVCSARSTTGGRCPDQRCGGRMLKVHDKPQF